MAIIVCSIIALAILAAGAAGYWLADAQPIRDLRGEH